AFDYALYRATSNAPAALLTHPLATHLTGLSYTDTSGNPGETYWYLVRATDTVNGLGEENTVRLSVSFPPAPGMFFEVSPGGSSHTSVDPGTVVSLSWNIPGATDAVLVGIGGFSGPSGSATVELEQTTTFVLYATVGGVQEVHTATGYVTGSNPQAVSHGPCLEPATTAIDIDGVLHYCRGVRNAQEPQLDKPAVWIPYTVADWELLVGPAVQPWSPYCFSAVGGDGGYAPFRYHIPGTPANEWRSPSNVAGLPEISGDGLDNNCNDSIDE
ncbi:MAG: hypothetical protein KDD47_08735, partial [Acidobacteria bacterium]|nr:hypothetical protein [Acidobacteriota bacterium]